MSHLNTDNPFAGIRIPFAHATVDGDSGGVEKGASVHGEENVAVVARGGDAAKRTHRAPAEAGGGAATSRDSLDKRAGEEDSDGGGSQAGAETRAEAKAARATRKGFDGGKPPISGEADVDRGALAVEKAARKGECGEGAEKATALEGEETPGQATEAAREMDGGGSGDGGEWRREVVKWRRCERNRIGIGWVRD
uniref:Uncharacterized protein n=1 Tax=Oryza rufipogon TaxID=4529 RepID=A0A0E0QHN0_ORYRU